jgi:hypothetical protein
MKWYWKTAILLGCGFLFGADTINIIRVLISEHDFARILPHLAVFIFMLIIMIPVILKSKEWYKP